MSGGYYNQQQGYGVQPEPAQYLQQNYAQQNPGFAPAYQQEYLRQPASSPYPTAPTCCMPEPATVLRVTETPQQEPRVIIVQQAAAPRPHDDDCCAPVRCLCRCVDWLLTQICYVLLGLVLLAVLIALGIWLSNKYNRHR